MERDQVAPLLFVAWLREFNRTLFATGSDAAFDDYWGLHPDVVASMLTEHPEWCDDRATPEVGDLFRPRSSSPRWSARSTSSPALWRRHGAMALGRAAPRARSPSASGRGFRCWAGCSASRSRPMAATTRSTAAPCARRQRPSLYRRPRPDLRMIVDLADPDAARFMISPGESGNVLSPHYGDLMGSGAISPMSASAAIASAARWCWPRDELGGRARRHPHRAAAIAGAVLRTPRWPPRRWRSLPGRAVVLKLETLHPTGSFKERGALNKLLSLDAGQRDAGVIAMSAGNHAQGVAYHARRLGIPATIVMPAERPSPRSSAPRPMARAWCCAARLARRAAPPRRSRRDGGLLRPSL